MKKRLPLNMITRVIMLPEGIIREIRRAPADVQPTLVKAYFKSERQDFTDYEMGRLLKHMKEQYTNFLPQGIIQQGLIVLLCQ